MTISCGQVVAALAGGALLGIAVVLVVRLHGMQRTGHQWRVDTAVRLTLRGVETFRQGGGASRSEPPDTPPYEAVVVCAKAHLQLLRPQPPRPGTARSLGRDSAPGRRAADRSDPCGP